MFVVSSNITEQYTGNPVLIDLHKIKFLVYLIDNYPDSLRYIKNDTDGLCKICKNPTTFYKGKYRKYCTAKCRCNDPETTQKISDGVKRNKQNRTAEQIEQENNKRQITTQQKYGVVNISQHIETKEKVKNTNIKQFGDWFLNTKECKDAFKNKFGYDNALQVQDIQEKMKQTNIERYGFAASAKNQDVRQKISKNKTDATFLKFLNFSQIEPLFNNIVHT
jgi:hypothetical protein